MKTWSPTTTGLAALTLSRIVRPPRKMKIERPPSRVEANQSPASEIKHQSRPSTLAKAGLE